ncbi:MAG: type IV pilus assembly protein PilM [Cyanobacteria bacterium NC_groundwater_1444_Ag_S-0.65um_54_12]|nr:type IV pilus assembly protein PilM [Cyanobacteria bacterium NC_groundwater_1444_Ag_S-0.65um_54_12]
MADLQGTVQKYWESLKKSFQRGSRIGLDITSDTIAVAELKRSRNALTLTNVAIANTPWNAVQDGEITDPIAVAEVIEQLLRENRITAKSAICAVAGQSTIVRPVRFPMMPASELREVILYEAERYIPFAMEEVNLGFEVIGEVEEDGALKQEVVLVAAQKNLIGSLVKCVQEARLTVDCVDVASFAVLRALADTDQMPDEQSVALVHIQGWTTDINVLQSGIPRFSRSVPIGYSYFLDAIVNALELEEDKARQVLDEIDVDPQGSADMSPQTEQAAEIVRPALSELVAEVGRSIDFYLSQGTEAIDRIVISGRGGGLKNLDRFLTSRLGLTTEVANPFPKIVIDERQFDPALLYSQASALATAIGLAMRGFQRL